MKFLEKLKPSKLFSPIFLKRWAKFKTLRRGYYSFIIVVAAYFFSFFCEFFINSNPFSITYNGKSYFTVYDIIPFKRDIIESYRVLSEKAEKLREDARNAATSEEKKKLRDEAKEVTAQSREILKIKAVAENGRELKKVLEEMNPANKVRLVMYPYGPNESLLSDMPAGVNPPTKPDSLHWLGTDDRGRDVFSRLVYGFRISLSFAIVVTIVCYAIGISIGALLGYYGGKFDIIMQRFVEIWSSLPFLYTVMIISSIMTPNFLLLVFILSLFGWMGMTYYIRAEFYREKNKDYVLAAIAIGVKDYKIIFKHILPNSLTPAISFAPFSIVGSIGSLVSLDFLGFGLPAPTPSWGELLGQGVGNLHSWWLVFSPISALFLTLLLISFLGEAVREAFDPKVYSRLR